ncbi:GTP-binding protein SAR1A-like [Pyrus ussuriensis x Pyrus communis]|uniref:GTP-binding protein SAR1A-like n=1 Tax=Pyrus ussuriensis x Pyrus communis TaxID=2448454 RepID=A0A5N5HK08_9ROSA|nr:GTP-binding protein SAR1A-like [Pyrus ussuriensis x Pyrus communis]
MASRNGVVQRGVVKLDRSSPSSVLLNLPDLPCARAASRSLALYIRVLARLIVPPNWIRLSPPKRQITTNLFIKPPLQFNISHSDSLWVFSYFPHNLADQSVPREESAATTAMFLFD